MRRPIRLAPVSRFVFETAERGGVAVITLRGELDLLASADLEPELERLADEPGVDVVALDLRGLDFLDSSGLRTILLARNRLLQQGRRLVLVRGRQPVQRVFEITRMTERLEFVDAPEHVHI
jgi:anti-sigma B factor antagonist